MGCIHRKQMLGVWCVKKDHKNSYCNCMERNNSRSRELLPHGQLAVRVVSVDILFLIRSTKSSGMSVSFNISRRFGLMSSLQGMFFSLWQHLISNSLRLSIASSSTSHSSNPSSFHIFNTSSCLNPPRRQTILFPMNEPPKSLNTIKQGSCPNVFIGSLFS
ncbi:hypothetical protein HanPI659440_Chr08g0299301 [Helianthus annuus]|nr:hypothetical protein HanPI659440_Chr08g0299301 [Helianthus annuus]